MKNESNDRLRVAIQKSGRLSERSQDVLKSCGLRFARSKDKLFWYGQAITRCPASPPSTSHS